MSPERREHKPYLFTHEDVARFAQEMALEQGGLEPILIVEGHKGTAYSQLEEFPDTHAGRKELMFQSGYVLAKSGPDFLLRQVFLISEGWMREADEDITPGPPTAQDPDRKEVLFVSGLTIEQHKTSMAIFEMERNAWGILVDLRDLEPPNVEEGRAESPLLIAFVRGYMEGMFGKLPDY